MNLNIRPAINSNSNNIIDLIFNIWINEYGFKVEKKDFPDLFEIEEYYIQKNGMFLIAETDTQIVGTIAYDKLNYNDFVLKHMFIKKDFRRQGIAQLLLDELLKNEENCSFYLSTKDSLAISAKNFYLKNNFEIINSNSLPKNFPFFYEDDLFMKKNIS